MKAAFGGTVSAGKVDMSSPVPVCKFQVKGSPDKSMTMADIAGTRLITFRA